MRLDKQKSDALAIELLLETHKEKDAIICRLEQQLAALRAAAVAVMAAAEGKVEYVDFINGTEAVKELAIVADANAINELREVLTENQENNPVLDDSPQSH